MCPSSSTANAKSSEKVDAKFVSPSHPLLHSEARHLFLLVGLLLEHLLHDLLLLNEEGADDAVLDAVGAPGAAVRPADGLLGLRDLGVLAGSEGGDLYVPCQLLCSTRS